MIITGLIAGAVYLNSLLPIITGYPAKFLCSAVFISHRNPADVEAVDLNFSFIRYVTNKIDYQGKSVTSRFLWGSSKAIYREGFGSTLLRSTDESSLRKDRFPASAGANYEQDTIAWPLGNIVPDTNTGIDKAVLARITYNLMISNRYHGTAYAFIVLHHGFPVAEMYRKGFRAGTRFPGWSMAKSFTNAMAGIMVRDGLLDIHEKAAIGSWQKDDRRNITINDLMQMQSGLEWNEDYGNRSDVTVMLYDSRDFSDFAYSRRQSYPAGSHWCYSSGSAVILNYLMRKKFGNDSIYRTYAASRLFSTTGMPDAVFETDPSGTQVGSSYIYATARDYARFGLLFLRDGVFNGERILPAGWVAYSTTPASHGNGDYGALFWLNRGNQYPSAPSDMYSCLGHDGQCIFIIPSRDLVVVVLGYSPRPSDEMDLDKLLGDIVGTVDVKIAK